MASTEFQISTYMRARLETWETDVDTANNTSVVHAKIMVWRTNSWSGQTWSTSVRRVITIDGTTVCDWTGEISHYLSYGEIEVANGSKTVTHNSDGSKSVGVSASLQDNVGAYFTGSGSLTMDLTTIARASQPSINTYPDNSPNFNVGDSITIHMNRKSSSFKHTVKLNYGSTSYTIATNVTDNCTFNTGLIADKLYAQMPNATSYSSTISVITYNGSTAIGTKTCAYTAKAVEANAKPSFSDFTYQDANSTITTIAGNNQYLVAGKSSLRVTISAANKAVAKYSASMKTYNASISGLSASADYSDSALDIDFTENTFTAGTRALAVRATDSRGYSATVSKNVQVLAYANPVVNATATRQNNFENTTTLVVSGSYSPLTIDGVAKNTVSSVKYRYKAQSTSTWGDWTEMAGLIVNSGGSYTTTNKTLNLDNNQAYDFQVMATDKLGSTTVSLVVAVGVPIFRIGTDGNVYNNEKRLVPYDEIVKYTTHVGQIIMTTKLTTAAQVANIYGGTWVAWGGGRVPLGMGSNGTTNYSTVEATGGEEKHTLTVAEMPSHTHTQNAHKHKTYSKWNSYGAGDLSGYGYKSPANGSAQDGTQQDYTNEVTATNKNTGGGGAHNNMQPYITVYFWKRTA